MKRLLFALILLLATVTPSHPADASGSNTVFMPVKLKDYSFQPAFRDESFITSKLFNYLESSQSNSILVARVDPHVFRTTYYYTYWGYEMDLAFAQYEMVTFKLYPRLNAILGVNASNEIVVLLPEVPALPPIGTGVLHD